MLSEEVTGEYDRFSIPVSDIPEDFLYELTSGRNLQPEDLPEGTEVEYWEIESAMESIDRRRDHDRAMDASIEKAVELMDDRSYDLILTEVDYDLMELKEDRRGDRWYQGEIDLMLVDIDEQVVRAVEVKPQKGLPRNHNGNAMIKAPTHKEKVEDQHRRQSYAFDLLNEELEDFDMHYIPEPAVYESELLPASEMPDIWEGRYRGKRDALEAMEDSEEFRAFMQQFVLPENPDILSEGNRLTRREMGMGEFVSEYLEENQV